MLDLLTPQSKTKSHYITARSDASLEHKPGLQNGACIEGILFHLYWLRFRPWRVLGLLDTPPHSDQPSNQ